MTRLRRLLQGHHDEAVARRANRHLQHRIEHLEEQNRRLRDTLAETARHRTRLALEMAEIRGSLAQVAVYEGIVDSGPVAMLVSEVVRDHEELEARIDAAMSHMRYLTSTALAEGQRPVTALEVIEEVSRLLAGGTRVPNTIEELTGE